MSKAPADFCPGCKKRCPAGAPKCKFGRTYFAKAHKGPKHKSGKGTLPDRLFGLRMPDRKHAFKWEKHLVTGGLGWKFLYVSRNFKKSLTKSPLTEEQIFSVLTPEEKESLSSILEKLNDSLCE